MPKISPAGAGGATGRRAPIGGGSGLRDGVSLAGTGGGV